MTEAVRIGRRTVGPGRPCFVVAEAGVNHNGDLDLARRLIDLAADAGADAVKFQAFDPDRLASAEVETAAYQRRTTGTATQRDLLRSLALPAAAWPALAAHAHERGIEFLCTAFDDVSAEVLDRLGVPAFKVPSGELDNLAFIARLAARGRPLIVSTGMATEEEVAGAVAAAAAAPGLCLLHCVSAYPAPEAAANLRVIPLLAARFGVPVGWSDHCEGPETALAAVALGACLLEKHVTVDRTLPGPDHQASADEPQFRAYVAGVRRVEAALGDGVKRPQAVELENRRLVRRSWHALTDLGPGERLGPDRVVLLRPATGLAPAVELDGMVVTRPVREGAPVTDADVRRDDR